MANSILQISFSLGLVGFIIIFLVQAFAKEKFNRFTAIGGMLIAQVFIVGIILAISQGHEKNTELRDLRQFLNQDSLNITLNNKSLDSNSTIKLLNKLRTIRSIGAHHSHPIDTTVLEINSPRETAFLTIGEDSQVQNEYWVFWSKSMQGNEVGRIYMNFDSVISAKH